MYDVWWQAVSRVSRQFVITGKKCILTLCFSSQGLHCVSMWNRYIGTFFYSCISWCRECHRWQWELNPPVCKQKSVSLPQTDCAIYCTNSTIFCCVQEGCIGWNSIILSFSDIFRQNLVITCIFYC